MAFTEVVTPGLAFEGRRDVWFWSSSGSSPSSKHTARTQMMSVCLSSRNSLVSELSAGLNEDVTWTCCAHSCAPERSNGRVAYRTRTQGRPRICQLRGLQEQPPLWPRGVGKAGNQNGGACMTTRKVTGGKLGSGFPKVIVMKVRSTV